MIKQTIDFECITPCFCAGVEQSQAEIRPSAIRGALRWWLRCLGGTLEQEEAVFGGSQSIKSSTIQVRISELKAVDFQIPSPAPRPMTPLAYILYFVSIAGNPDGKAKFGTGARWNAKGALGPGSSFILHLRQLRNLPVECEELLQSSIEAFRHYGSVGLRITRGFGAIQDKQVTPDSFKSVNGMLEKKGFVLRKGRKAHKDWVEWMHAAGNILQNDLRKNFGAGGNKKPPQASALGSINPVRQTSAVYLRPIKENGNLIFNAFEAPHAKVLGEMSSRPHSKQILLGPNFLDHSRGSSH